MTLSVYDQGLYQQDVLFCQTSAAKYSPDFDGNSIALGLVQGGAANISEVPLSPLVPVIGALGGAASSGANSLDVFGQAQSNVFKNCLHDKTMQDRSAILVNPN